MANIRDASTVAGTVRRLRERALLSQEALAARAGLSVGTIRALEAGRIHRPRGNTLRLLAGALAVPEKELSELLSATSGTPADDGEHVKPAQLPAVVAGFVGRLASLKALDETLVAVDIGPGVPVVISAIAGTPGVGKTSLAVYWAHRVADRFPDGQLYVNLRGFGPGGRALPPADALRRFLDALGVAPQRIPADLDSRAALYRSLVAGKRMLVLLDNARNAEQVRPLLPGSATVAVVVTSRDRLTPLVAIEGARPLTLDLLSTQEARELLVGRLGIERAASEPEAIDAIVAACARLPLALAIAAARAQDSGFPLAAIARELADATRRLDTLDVGDPAARIRSVLSWSCNALSPPAAGLFRLLGLHPGGDISAAAAAALAGRPLAQVGPLLAEGVRASLVNEPTPGRYTCHDLLHAYAGELAAQEPESEQRTALTRLLDHYTQTAAAAIDVASYEPQRRHTASQADTTTITITTADVSDRQRAERWLDTEMANLLAVAEHAAQHGWPRHTWQLSATLDRHLRTRGRYREAEALHRHACNLARHFGDRPAEIDALTRLGTAHRIQGRYEQALGHYQRALQIAQDTGDRIGELQALTGLGHVHQMIGRHHQATDHHRRAVRIAQDLGDPVSELQALTGLGHVHRLLGNYEEAGDDYGRAVRIARDIADRLGELQALTGLGHVHRLLGRYEQAGEQCGRALRIAQDIGDRFGILNALNGLAVVDLALGRCEQAGEHARRALRIAQDIGNRSGELAALNKLGCVHRRVGRCAEAADYYRRAFDLARGQGDRNWQFEALQGMGRLHHATGDLDFALLRHEQALQLATDLAQPADQARAHDGLAHANLALNDHDRACRHWQHALDILTGLGTDHTEEAQVSIPRIRDHLNALDQ